MTNDKKIAWKHAIKNACLALLQQRMDNASLAMAQAQDNANNQEKSSAGDKYETTRAMGQQDHAMNARQLQEAQRDHNFLSAIHADTIHSSATTGSVIELGNSLLFIAIGLGRVETGNGPVMVVSHKSPLFEQLKNKKAGDVIVMNGKEQEVKSVF